MKKTKQSSLLVMNPGEARVPATVGQQVIAPPATKAEIIEALVIKQVRQAEAVLAELNKESEAMNKAINDSIEACRQSSYENARNVKFDTITYRKVMEVKSRPEYSARFAKVPGGFVTEDLDHPIPKELVGIPVAAVKLMAEPSEPVLAAYRKLFKERDDWAKGLMKRIFPEYETLFGATNRNCQLAAAVNIMNGGVETERYSGQSYSIMDLALRNMLSELTNPSRVRFAIKSRFSTVNTDARVERLLQDKESSSLLDDMLAKLKKASAAVELKKSYDAEV